MITELFAPRERRATSAYQRGGSLAEPPSWLHRLLGGRESAAGVQVTERNCVTWSAILCAVQVITGAFRTMPVMGYRRRPDGGKSVERGHAVHGIVHDQANPEMPASWCRGYLQACKLIWGNGYAEIVGDRRWEYGMAGGRVLETWPIHPSRVRVHRNLDSGQLEYVIDGGAVVLPWTRVLHLRGYSDDGITGRTLVDLAGESIGLSLAAESYGAQFFGNGAEPGGVIQRPLEAPELGPQGVQNMRSTWYQQQGAGRRHSVAILEEGSEWKATSVPNENAQYLETRTFQIQEAARWLNIPPHMLMELSRATFSNISHQRLEFLWSCLAPHQTDYQDEVGLKLFTAEERSAGYFVEFVNAATMLMDHQQRSEFYTKLFNMGAITPNEIRALENMNPLGPAGDRVFVPVNLVALEKAHREADAPAKPETSAAEQSAQATLAFRREAWLGFQRDGTVADVQANLTDLKALERLVGLPVNEEYTDPLLPVTGDGGPLVAGTVIKDEEGDAIGAGVIGGGEAAATAAGNDGAIESAGDGATEGNGDGGGEGGSEGASGGGGDAGNEGASGGGGEGETGGDGETAGADAGAALWPVFLAVGLRLARKERAALERALKKHATDEAAFAEWADGFYHRQAIELIEEFAAPSAAAATLRGGDARYVGASLEARAQRVAGDNRVLANMAWLEGGELPAAEDAAERIGRTMMSGLN